MTSYSEFFDAEVEKSILQNFKSKFTSECETMSSSQNVYIRQGTTIINYADISGCDIRTTQTLRANVGQYCLNIPKLLSELTQFQRQSLINSIVTELKTELLRKYSNKTRFINALCDKLGNELNIITYIGTINDVVKNKDKLKDEYIYLSNQLLPYSETKDILKIIEGQLPIPLQLSSSIRGRIIALRMNKQTYTENTKTLNSSNLDLQLYNKVIQSCEQNILVDQNQNIELRGTIECKDGGGIMNIQKIAVDAQSECFVKPVLQKVKNDAFLQRLYIQGDNVGCKFYLEYGLCSNNQRKITTKILSGNCSNINTEEIVPCDNPKCNISNWSDWSVCNFTNGKATRFRTRKFIKQGEDCNNVMKEVEECNIPDRYAGNDLINKNALKYDLYDTYRGVLDKNTYILLFILLTILVIFVTIL